MTSSSFAEDVEKRNKKTLLLIYNEESLRKRRRCVKGARLLAQDMRTHLLTNDPFKPSNEEAHVL